MNKKRRKKKPKPRLPIEAVIKLRSHPVISGKGEKIYRRERIKEQDRKNKEKSSTE